MASRNKVLVVDDEEEFLLMLKNALEIRGIEVVVAASAVEAGVEIAIGKPALILMDIRMAGINGFQACEALKRNPVTKDIPIIVVSAISDEAEIRKAHKIGVVDYFVKPVDMEKLIAKIKEIVEV